MAIAASPSVLAFVLAATGALSASASVPVYVLEGYRFEGLEPKITASLVARLKHHRGDRVREADIKSDVDVLAKELRTRHLRGRLFTGFQESGSRLWVWFNLVPLAPPQGAARWMFHRLQSQHFEGPPGLSESALTAATRLRLGDTISTDNLDDARRGLLALYARSRPGKKPPILQLRVEVRPLNQVTLTWILHDRK